MSDLLDPPIIHMPEFVEGTWLNTAEPPTKARLRGQVVLIDFWDYTCVNCLRTLPYLREWHRRYQDKGLRIIGIHTPEFKFAGYESHVAAAIEALELPYPILLDADHSMWTQYATRAWPTKFLIDSRGYVRYKRQGEGYYVQTEEAIQQLLRLRDPGVWLPGIMPPLQAEDAPGAVCFRTTPELYAGYQGGGLFGSALGNPEGYVTDGVMMYSLPDEEVREEGQFFVEGFWRALPESLAFAGEDGGRIVLPYAAEGVNAVLSPSGDNVALMLDLWQGEREPLVEVRQDGSYLNMRIAGRDVWYDERGRRYLRITRPRMYEIVRNRAYESHELELIVRARGIALYAFTFNTCVAPRSRYRSQDVFQRR